MSEVGVICAHAPSLKKLEKELVALLAGRSADDVLGVSHYTAPVSTRQHRGIWSGSRQTHKLEYSAVVLIRADQPNPDAVLRPPPSTARDFGR
jgi:hypothetical protein